ncbi:MAG: GNAT family N-acetyltransferase [Microvirga sp.]
MGFAVRRLREEDRPGWARLYAGYAAFYEVTQTEAMREVVWSWIVDPAKEVEGFAAVDDDGTLLGIAHVRPFARPLSASTGGYLDDLFVDPGSRGRGIADALIEAVKQEGERRGWSVIRWITAEDNARARAVYERHAACTPWITYDIRL